MVIRVVEFSSGGYKIGNVFASVSTYSKEIIEFWELVLWGGVKKCHYLTFKVNFLHQKSSESFTFFSLNNTNLGAHFLLLVLFENIHFWVTLLLKWCPIFDNSPLHQFSKFYNFLSACWFLGKNLSNFVSLAWKLDNPY